MIWSKARCLNGKRGDTLEVNLRFDVDFKVSIYVWVDFRSLSATAVIANVNQIQTKDTFARLCQMQTLKIFKVAKILSSQLISSGTLWYMS